MLIGTNNYLVLKFVLQGGGVVVVVVVE